MYYRFTDKMSLSDFVKQNEELLHDKFVETYYNNYGDMPDFTNYRLQRQFEEVEYINTINNVERMKNIKPSQLRIRDNNKLLKWKVRWDSAYLDGVIVGDYAVLYPIWVK